MKNILLIHTGGTFGMVPVEPNQSLAPGNLQNQILTHVPEIGDIADIDVEIPFNLDSSAISIREWNRLAELIDARLNAYDGFIIVHGTDTMVYTAAALSFSLIHIGKPVILTGSQLPLAQLRSDARQNLIDAVELATLDLPEVAVVFGQRILRGSRAKKTSISSFDAFDTPNYPRLGEIGLRIVLNRKYILPREADYRFMAGFGGNAALLHVLPMLDPQRFQNLLDSELQALILVGFGAGNLPNSAPDWIPFIRSASEKGICVFVGSHSMHGSVDLTIYESGRQAMEAGAIGLNDMTTEASYVKLLKILSVENNPEEIKLLMKKSWAGEISE